MQIILALKRILKEVSKAGGTTIVRTSGCHALDQMILYQSGNLRELTLKHIVKQRERPGGCSLFIYRNNLLKSGNNWSFIHSISIKAVIVRR